MQILIDNLSVEAINAALLRIQRSFKDNQASLTSNVNKIISNTSGVSSKYDDTALRNEISALQAILFQVQQSDENQNKRLDDHEEQIDQNVQNIATLQNLMSNIKFEYDIDTNTITFTNPSGDKVEVLLKDTTYSFAWDSETHALSIVDNFTGETIFSQVVDTFYSFSWSNGILTISDNRHDSPIKQISFDDRYYTESEIQTLILDLIPSTASPTNQLADKNWVNSSIETSTATFRGTFDSTSQISSVAGDKNDYLFVKALNPSTGLYTYTKYTWVEDGGDFGHWKYAYDLNTSGFTSDQLAALNSGITCTIVQNLLDGCYTGKTAHTLNNAVAWKSLLATKNDASATYCDSSDYFNTNVLADFSHGYIKANRYQFNDREGYTNRSISGVYSAANLGVGTTCGMSICEFFCRVATCNKLRGGEKLTVNYGWSNSCSMRLNYPDGTSNCVSGWVVQFWPDTYTTDLWDNTKSGWYNIFAEINTLTSKRLFRIYKGSNAATCATVTEIKYANAEKATNATNATNATCFDGNTWSDAITAIRPACTNTTTNALYPILLGTICNDCNGSLSEVYKNTNMFANPSTGRLVTCQHRTQCLLVSTLSEGCTGFNSSKWIRMDLNTGVSNQLQINGPQNSQKGIYLSTEGGAAEYKNIALAIGSGNENRGLGHYSGGSFCWLQYYDCDNCERHTRPTEFFVDSTTGGGITIRSKCDGTYANAPQGASLTFTNCGNTQPLCLVYEDRDSYRSGNSLTLKSSQTDVWFVTPRLETSYIYNFGGCATCVAANCCPSIVFTMRCIYCDTTWKACNRTICFCGSDGSVWANDVRRASYAGFVYTCYLPSAGGSTIHYVQIKTGRMPRSGTGKTFEISFYSMNATLNLEATTNYYCGTCYGNLKYSKCGYTCTNCDCFWLSYNGYRNPVLCSDDNFEVICSTTTAPSGITFSDFSEYISSTALTGITLNGTSATVENNVATLDMTPVICRCGYKVCVGLGNKCSAEMTLPNEVYTKRYTTAGHNKYLLLGKVAISSGSVSALSLLLTTFGNNDNFNIHNTLIEVTSGSSANALCVKGWTDIDLTGTTDNCLSIVVTKDTSYWNIYACSTYTYQDYSLRVLKAFGSQLISMTDASTVTGTVTFDSTADVDKYKISYIKDSKIFCASRICRNAVSTGTYPVLLTGGTTSLGCACVNVSSGQQLTFNAGTGLLSTTCLSLSSGLSSGYNCIAPLCTAFSMTCGNIYYIKIGSISACDGRCGMNDLLITARGTNVVDKVRVQWGSSASNNAAAQDIISIDKNSYSSCNKYGIVGFGWVSEGANWNCKNWLYIAVRGGGSSAANICIGLERVHLNGWATTSVTENETTHWFQCTTTEPSWTCCINLKRANGTLTYHWDNMVNDHLYTLKGTGATLCDSNLGNVTTISAYKNDNSGGKTVTLMYDITSWYNGTTGVAGVGFVGSLYATRISGYTISYMANIAMTASYGRNGAALANGVTLQLYYQRTSGNTMLHYPVIIKDSRCSTNVKYWLAMLNQGSGHDFVMIGQSWGTRCREEILYNGSALPTGLEILMEAEPYYLYAGNRVSCTDSVTGKSGIEMRPSGQIFMNGTAPELTFYHNNSCTWSSSVYQNTAGELRLAVRNATGCTASTEAYCFCFCSNGYMYGNVCGNATCFGGCTYSQACTDIRSGLCNHDCLVKYSAVSSSADRNILMMGAGFVDGCVCPVYFNSNAKLTFNTNNGQMNLGPIVACTSQCAGVSGLRMGRGFIELSAATPFIDFHRSHYCGDFSSRIIDFSNGLQIYVNDGTGCTASTTQCIFCFTPTGVFKSPYDICSTYIRATNSIEALNFYNMTQLHGTQPAEATCCPNIIFDLRCRYNSGTSASPVWSLCDRCIVMCGCDGGLYATHKGCSCLNWHGIVTCQCNYSLTANTVYYIKVGRLLDGFMTGTTELDIMASGDSLVDKINIKWLGGRANDAANVNGIEINATNWAPLKGLLGIGWVRTGTGWNCANDIYIKVCAPATSTYCFGLNRTLLGCSGAAWTTGFSCTTTAPTFTCFVCTKPNGAKAFHWTSGTLEAACVKVGDVYQFSYTKPENGNQPIFYGMWDITNHICNTGTKCLAGFNGKVLSMTATNNAPVESVDIIGKITSCISCTLTYANRICADFVKPAIMQCISSSTCSYYLGFILCGSCQIYSFNGFVSPHHLLTTPKIFYYNGSDACYHLDSCTGTTKGNITVEGTECIRDSNAACCINHLVCFRTRDWSNSTFGTWVGANLAGNQVTLPLPACSTWIGLKANCSMILPIGHNNSSYIQGEIWITC